MNIQSLLSSIRKKHLSRAYAKSQARRKPRLRVEGLEERAVPATLPAPEIDPTSSRSITGAFSPTLVADPTNPFLIVQASQSYSGAETIGEVMYSRNGGESWQPLSTLGGDLDPKTNNTIAYSQVGTVSVAFDRFSNIYVTYAETNADFTSGRIMFRKYDMTSATQTSFKILYRWIDSDQAHNPFVAVDANMPFYGDPDIVSVTNATWAAASGGIATITSPAHGLNGGESVTISGVRPAGYNGTFTIITATADSFTYALAADPGSFVDGPDTNDAFQEAIEAFGTAQNQTRVFVAWNTVTVAPTGAGNFNPNVIKAVVSADGGTTFAAPILLNSDLYNDGGALNAYSQPKMLFTPGRAGGDEGGTLITTFSDHGEATRIRVDSHVLDATNVPRVVEVTNLLPEFINDALDGDPNDSPQTTTFDLSVPSALVGGLGELNDIDDLAVTLNIDHNDLSELQIELVSPNGIRHTLVRNGKNSAGQATGAGITGTVMGVFPGGGGNLIGTTFQDNAARFINDGNVTGSKTGSYKPEGGAILNTKYGSLSLGQMSGVTPWRIVITDFVFSNNPPVPRSIYKATLQLSQDYVNGQDPDISTGAAPAVGSATGLNYPSKPVSNPGLGIGPGVSMAIDNSMGGFSQYQNRLFVAYSDGGNVLVRYNDTGGTGFWSPATTVGAGFTPAITVDAGTGTLIVAYYSAAGDASGARSALMFSSAVAQPLFGNNLGLIEFNTPSFVNAKEEYWDQIKQEVLEFEPIRTNPSVAALGVYGYGNNLGLVSNNGRVTLNSTGNLNTVGTQTRTQRIRLAAGARAVLGDTGPIMGDTAIPQTEGTLVIPPGDSQVTEVLQDFNPILQVPYLIEGATLFFNNTFAADGLRRFDGFVFEFDRVVDVSTVTLADITVKYHAPNANPALFGENISGQVTSIQRLDFYEDSVTGRDYGSKRFLVHLLPQSRVGSYSYSVGADISDRIRELAVDYVLGASDNFNSSDTPVVITDFIDPDVATISSSIITVAGGAFPAGSVIGEIKVRLEITHGDLSQLLIRLVPPVGPTIILVNQGDAGPGGPGFDNTVFADSAAQTLSNDVPPYTSFANYKPAESFSQLFANAYAGDWELQIIDLDQGVPGVLTSWQLEIVPAALAAPVETLGNLRDQDNDGVTNEPIEDTFAVPNPINGVPFVLPYKVGSLPITISGPRLMETHVGGSPASLDNVVIDKKVKTIDLRFDRVLDASTFGTADVLRIIGPLGEIPISGLGAVVPTVTPIDGLGGLAISGNSRFFRVSFKEQQLAGTYRVQLGSQISDTFGNLLDTDHDAGVAQMTGGDIGTPTQVEEYIKTFAVPIAIPAHAATNITLDVPDAYLMEQVVTTLSITHPNLRQLTAKLYGPTTPPGNGVLLFSNTPLSGSTANMLNTTFDDGAAFPIQTGSGPFGPFPGNGAGGYTPVQPLSQLNDTSSFGSWRLEILNSGSFAGSINQFDLKLTGDVIGPGTGETISDQVSAGFRIHISGGGTSVGLTNWTPIGPAGHVTTTDLNDDTVGRVGAIAVDTTDATGNTVYAAGASGGVWRTTNFLTREVIGPTWVPLTDFGPANAINVGALALYPSADRDPSKTTVLVGTGSEPLNRLEFDEMNGDPKYRFDGVGFLISEDAGRTWEVLDSTNNYNPALAKYRPVVDASTVAITAASQVGGTVTITTATAHGLGTGIPITIAGVGVAGYNGTFPITSVSAPNKFTYTTAAGLAASSGGTASSLDRRTHTFVGAVVNKVVVEDKVDPVSGRPIIWAAVGSGRAGAAAAGLWRSQDGGRTWVRIRAGEAVDFALSAGSVKLTSLGRPTLGYLSVEGVGMLRSVQLNGSMPSFTLMDGGVGRPEFVGDPNSVVTVDAPPETPNGNKNRIVLAVPSLVAGDPLANSYYQRWVYAAVAEDSGEFDGLYLSKDAGANWTRLLTGGATPSAFFTHFGGNHSLSLAVDPTDPNIVYMGSYGLLRIDATFTNDPYNLSLYQHSNADGGVTRDLTRGGVDVTDRGGVGGGLIAISPDPAPYIRTLTPGDLNASIRRDPRNLWNQLNLLRDPFQPFITDTSLQVSNVLKFFNDAQDTVIVSPMIMRDGNLPGTSPDELDMRSDDPFTFVWASALVAVLDPLTGKARILMGADEGITTFVNNSDGSLDEVIGFDQRGVNLTQATANPVVDTLYKYTPYDESDEERDLQVEGIRNGNLQIARLYSGDLQPSLLAATIAQSLTVAAGRRQNDVPRSDSNILDTGNLLWDDVGRIGRANYVATDSTGTGTTYILRRINDISQANPDPNSPLGITNDLQDFFQVSQLGGRPFSRTVGLFRPGSDDQTGAGQWDNTIRNLAVNPLDPNAVIMGSNEGRLYRILDATSPGGFWDVVAEPAELDGAYTRALAFGAPLDENAAMNDYMYVGTEDGGVFVTTNGGGTAGTWTNISNGLPAGEEVLKIIPNPTRGTVANPAAGAHEAYLVTETGVYYMADWSLFGAIWVNVSTNLPTIQHLAFGDPEWSLPVIVNQQDTPELLTIAVDWRPAQANTNPQRPILYAGGDGGVFRGTWVTQPDLTQQVVWRRYPDLAGGSTSPGGGLPVVKVTDLDLAVGNLDPNTGEPASVGSVDILVATTLGRGQWAIAVGQTVGLSGPRIIDASPITPQFTAPTFIDVEFDTFMSVTSFDVTDVVIKSPAGVIIPSTLVEDITYLSLLQGQFNAHNKYRIHFQPLTSDGTYTITIGPDVRAGNGITPMNQDGDAINGELLQDQYKFSLVVGVSDMADFVKDVYEKFVGRVPTAAEYASSRVKSMVTARQTALTVVLKELLISHNANDARKDLIKRLFDNGNAPGEIGHFLPAPFNSVADETAYLAGMNAGTMTPEKVLISIMSKPEYFDAADGTAGAVPATTPLQFLTKVYADLFKGLGITPQMLPTSTMNAQLTQALTPTGRATLVKNLVNGTAVRYDPTPASPYLTTSFRHHFVNLAYEQYLPNYTPTATELSAARTLMAKAPTAVSPAVGNLGGSEWVVWKILSSKVYFETKTQAGGPDAGLRSNRAWVAGVVSDRMYRAALASEQDTFSQKVLDLFNTQRQVFVQSVVYSKVYRTEVVNDYYQLIHGRVPTTAEMTSAINSFVAGVQIPSLMAARFARPEYYLANGGPNNLVWATSVYTRLGIAATAPEISALAAQGTTETTRKNAVYAILRGTAYRTKLINDTYLLLLNRVPLAAETTAYLDFLSLKRWELMAADMLSFADARKNSTTLAAAATQDNARHFWEVAN